MGAGTPVDGSPQSGNDSQLPIGNTAHHRFHKTQQVTLPDMSQGQHASHVVFPVKAAFPPYDNSAGKWERKSKTKASQQKDLLAVTSSRHIKSAQGCQGCSGLGAARGSKQAWPAEILPA